MDECLEGWFGHFGLILSLSLLWPKVIEEKEKEKIKIKAFRCSASSF